MGKLSLMADDLGRDTTVQRRRKRDAVAYEMDLRLENWARCMRGGLLLGYPRVAEPGTTPDVADASLVERALLDMKNARGSHYRVIWLTYIARYSDKSISELKKIRCPEHQVKNLRREAYFWLDARLPPI